MGSVGSGRSRICRPFGSACSWTGKLRGSSDIVLLARGGGASLSGPPPAVNGCRVGPVVGRFEWDTCKIAELRRALLPFLGELAGEQQPLRRREKFFLRIARL